MNKQFKKRRMIPVALALMAVVVLSGVAYAYWTANGSGAGTGKAAAGTSDVVVNQTTVFTGMYPGDTAQTIGGDFTNLGSGPVYVTSITATISSVILADGTTVGDATTCSAADFTLAPTAAVGAEIPVGTHVGAWGNAVLPIPVVTMTIKFHDTALNQDACKNATVHLSYSAS